jgi:hypothetical protein
VYERTNFTRLKNRSVTSVRVNSTISGVSHLFRAAHRVCFRLLRTEHETNGDRCKATGALITDMFLYRKCFLRKVNQGTGSHRPVKVQGVSTIK